MDRRQALLTMGRYIGLAAGAALLPGWSLSEASRRSPAIPRSRDYDLLLRGGTVIDGTGAPGFTGDIGIRDGRIATLGNLGQDEAPKVIDCSGLYVCPGIINLHSHTFEQVFNYPGNDSALLQGITTEVGGVDGRSSLPLRDHLARVASMGTGANYAMLVGQGAVRTRVMGHGAAAAGRAQILSMQRVVAQAMEDGAFGMSNALEYIPDRYSSTPEIIALASIVGRYGGHYATHLRCEGKDMPRALEEAFRVSDEAGVPLHISHLKVRGHANWYLAPTVMKMLSSAPDRGIPLTADIYPYLGAIYTANLPLRDAWPRHRPEHLIIKTAADPEYTGRSVASLAESLRITSEDLVRHLLRTDPGTMVAAEEMREEHLVQFLRAPYTIPSNDASAREWYDSSIRAGRLHPRTYGTFPRVFGRYVRRLRTLSWEEAVHRVTGKAAGLLGLRERGILRPGYAADLMVLDPESIADRATWQSPQALPDGICHVLVNGRVAVRGGSLEPDARHGKILQHG